MVAELRWSNHARVGEVEVVAGSEKWVPLQINTRPCTFSCVHIARVSWSISGPVGHVIAELWWSSHAGVGGVEVFA